MKELQRYELHDIPDRCGSVMAGHKSGSWCDAHEAIAALEAAEAEKAAAVKAEQIFHNSTKKLLADAEAREAELRARVAELEGIVGDCQIMGFLQPKADASPTHRELVKRTIAIMAGRKP